MSSPKAHPTEADAEGVSEDSDDSQYRQICPGCGTTLCENTYIMTYASEAQWATGDDTTFCYDCYWENEHYRDDHFRDNLEEVAEGVEERGIDPAQVFLLRPPEASTSAPMPAPKPAPEPSLTFAQMYEKGQNYYFGRNGVAKDHKEAVKWYLKAGEQGFAIAQSGLGECYYSGFGVGRDYKEAVKWYRKAAEQGHAGGQYNLGKCYYLGHGVAKDHKEAVLWFRKAAEQGNTGAKRQLEMAWARPESKGRNLSSSIQGRK